MWNIYYLSIMIYVYAFIRKGKKMARGPHIYLHMSPELGNIMWKRKTVLKSP